MPRIALKRHVVALVRFVQAGSIARLMFLAIALSVFLRANLTPAGTIVIVNHRAVPMRFAVSRHGGGYDRVSLEPLRILPLPVTGPVHCTFGAGDDVQEYHLQPGSIYVFRTDEIDRTLLECWALSETAADKRAASDKLTGVDYQQTGELGQVAVKILVDDDEVLRRHVWEPKLRRRIAAASEILTSACRLRLEIVAIDAWDSDDAIIDFGKSMMEFEQEVTPGVAQLAIGFTNQYTLKKGQVKMGGTRGPLHSHIMIREYGPRISEAERLEILLHEVGHFLGAAHSPASSSVMRPVLGDGRIHRRKFRFAFDPLNTLAINLISEAWRKDGSRRISTISLEKRARLAEIYQAIAEALPKDPAAKDFLKMMRADRGPISPAPLEKETKDEQEEQTKRQQKL